MVYFSDPSILSMQITKKKHGNGGVGDVICGAVIMGLVMVAVEDSCNSSPHSLRCCIDGMVRMGMSGVLEHFIHFIRHLSCHDFVEVARAPCKIRR